MWTSTRTYQGNGRRDMEEREKDLYSLNLLEYKDKKEEFQQAEREKLANVAGKVIADAVKKVTDPPSQSQVD